MMFQGLMLMFVGMGIVIAFLSIIVLLLSFSRSVARHFDHLLPDDAPAAPRAAATPLDEETALAIAIAVAYKRA
jgi:sodium pump decarboxylase gamma subunit